MKILGAVSVLMMALLVLSACGGGTEPVTESAAAVVPTAEPTATAEPSAEAAPTAEPIATPSAAPTPEQKLEGVKYGGTFRRTWSDPPTLDPHLASDTTAAGLIVEIFSGLVTITPDLRLGPDLAERWDVSDDKMVYTFYLRKNAKFHDGKPVTAQDFKYSFERAADPELVSPVADTYLGDIVGVKDKLNGRANKIRGVKVIDNNTLQITIDAPKSYFLAKLTYPTAYVVDEENVERLGRNWTRKPNGTGPFKLREYLIGERIILERNDLYYGEKAKLDRVEMILSGGSAMAMYENDEIHITGVGLADLDRVQNPSDPLNRDVRYSPPSFDVTYIGLNFILPPFDDPNVRKALNHAINKEFIADQVLNNLVIPSYGVLPPGFPGYTGEIEGLQFDQEEAWRLLTESKYADAESSKRLLDELLVEWEKTSADRGKSVQLLGEWQQTIDLPRIILTVPGTGGGLTIDLEIIIEMWRQILGVEVEIQQVEWATYLRDLNQQRLQMYAGLAWQADYPDPEDFLDVLFHSKSEINHGDYSNFEVDRILEQARIEQDWNRRVDLYQQAEQLIIDDAPWIPLWFSTEGVVLVKPYVKGYELTPMIVPKLAKVWIDKP